MGNASAKRQAVINKGQLFSVHIASALIYGSTFLYFKLSKHHFYLQFMFALPGILAEMFLDKWCRPRYGQNKTLISPGIDFRQGGVIDYVKDIVILNWIIVLLSVAVGLKAWLLVFLIPTFLTFKAFQLLKAGKQLLGGGGSQPQSAAPQTEPTKRKMR